MVWEMVLTDAVENEDSWWRRRFIWRKYPCQNITVPENPGCGRLDLQNGLALNIYTFLIEVTVVEGEDENVAVESTDNAPINVLPYMRV